MSKNLIERLNEGPVLCAEGYLFAMERRGYLQAGAFVPEVVLEHPEVVSQLHREFIRSGSDVVQAFTYYGHREKLRIIGKENLLEPLQANPVIIEDNCFVGARAEIAEGVVVEKGSVLSMGVYIGASTRISARSTGELIYGKVPSYSVVVPGSMPSKNNPDGPSLYCVVIVKKVDEKTRSKTSINDLLRD